MDISRGKEPDMSIYTLTDGGETVGIYSTEKKALAAAHRYIDERMWHACQVLRRPLDSDRFYGSTVLWYEDCGKLVRWVD
jgi:hypothetical protein